MSKSIRPAIRAPYICSQCLSKPARRRFTSSHTLRAPPPPPPSSGFAELSNRSIVSLTGHDAPKFLQGLTTNNVDPSRTEGWYSGLLNAQGRVLYDAFIYPYKPSGDAELGYLVEVDRDEAEGFVKHLKRHKLRSKVQVRNAGEEWRVWSTWEDNAATKRKPEDPGYTASALPRESQILMRDPRLASLGHRILLGEGQGTPPQQFARYEALEETSLEAYKIRRYLAGIAEGQKEIFREGALPLESNMDYLSGIDFRKGCYVGQELTIRTQHTGVVRKRILPVRLYSPSSSAPSALAYSPEELGTVVPESGTDVKAQGGRRPAGKFLAGIGNIGLALCRLENMTDLRVSAEGGTYKEGMEFDVGGVRVKAFVPEWLRAREEEKLEKRLKREEAVMPGDHVA